MWSGHSPVGPTATLIFCARSLWYTSPGLTVPLFFSVRGGERETSSDSVNPPRPRIASEHVHRIADDFFIGCSIAH